MVDDGRVTRIISGDAGGRRLRTPDGDGTKAVCTSVFDSVEGLRTVLEMGVVEGATEAIGQIDDLLARG